MFFKPNKMPISLNYFIREHQYEIKVKVMKGVELPVNVLIIVVLALIVLLAIIALFFGVWNPTQITAEAAKNSACYTLLSTGCEDPERIATDNFDANNDGVVNEYDTLQELCENYYGIDPSSPDRINDCKKIVCRCE
jgi:hypothetical protein